jgi:hypothetical protein
VPLNHHLNIFVHLFVLVMLYVLCVCSATPKLYLAKPPGIKSEIESGDDQRKGNKKNKGANEKTLGAPQEMSRARDMAEKVKASTVMVSVGPGSLQSGTTEETAPTPGRKKEKKNKKIIRMAGGQIWEDNSLLDWEDGECHCRGYWHSLWFICL